MKLFPISQATKFNLNDFEAGCKAATEEMRDPHFNMWIAITSFDNDPADSAFQHGFLNKLKSAWNRKLEAEEADLQYALSRGGE